MGRSDTLYASPSNLHRRQRLQMFDGDIRILRVNLNGVEEDRGTSLNEVTWASDNETVVAVASASISVPTATASVTATASSTGTANISCTATFGDGSVAVVWWKTTVKDDG